MGKSETTHKHQQNSKPTTPFNQIKTTRTALILGKATNIRNRDKPAIQQRTQQAKNTWGKLKNKLLTNRNIKLEIRIPLWNATVRTIPTYGLQTRTRDKNNMKP